MNGSRYSYETSGKPDSRTAQAPNTGARGNAGWTGMDERTMRADPETPTGMGAAIVKAVACWAALIATILCNGLFEAMRLGGVTAAEVSNQVFAWFTPAGYVFSIWALIYAALAVWMIYATWQAFKGIALSGKQVALFTASCALNIGWLAAFHFQMITFALVLLIALWGVLAMLYIDIWNTRTTMWELVPFSIYFSWATVAVIANATNLATRSFDIPLIANQVSTVVLASLVLLAAGIVARSLKDLVFPLVAYWAAIGVGVHLLNVDFMLAVVLFALTGAVALATYLYALVRMGRASREEPGMYSREGA